METRCSADYTTHISKKYSGQNAKFTARRYNSISNYTVLRWRTLIHEVFRRVWSNDSWISIVTQTKILFAKAQTLFRPQQKEKRKGDVRCGNKYFVVIKISGSQFCGQFFSNAKKVILAGKSFRTTKRTSCLAMYVLKQRGKTWFLVYAAGAIRSPLCETVCFLHGQLLAGWKSKPLRSF